MRVGDAIQRDQQPRAGLVIQRIGDQIARMSVLVAGQLQRDTLMYRAPGEPVEFSAGGLQQRNRMVSGVAKDLP